MALTKEKLALKLNELITKRRALHDHPFILKFRRGELSRDEVRTWIEQQFYLTGRVHDLLGPLYAHCEDASIRAEIINNLVEEETGKISGTAPHPELYIRLGEALGSTRERMLKVQLLSESVALRAYWVLAAEKYPFAEALAAVKRRRRGTSAGCRGRIRRDSRAEVWPHPSTVGVLVGS